MKIIGLLYQLESSVHSLIKSTIIQNFKSNQNGCHLRLLAEVRNDGNVIGSQVQEGENNVINHKQILFFAIALRDGESQDPLILTIKSPE